MAEYEVGSIVAAIGGKKDTKKKAKKQAVATVVAAADASEEAPALASFFSASSQLFGKKTTEPEFNFVTDVPASTSETVDAPATAASTSSSEPAVAKKVKKPKHKKKAAEEAAAAAAAAAACETTTPEAAPAATDAAAADTEDSGDIEKDARTIFIGNVSLEATIADIKKHFLACGKIESVRLRSVPVAGCKVDKNGKQNLVKKVCANKKIFVDGRDSCNAYLVFVDHTSVDAALALNGSEFCSKVIRVDRKTVSMDAKRSVFVGNVAFTATDDDVRKHFEKALRDGDDTPVVESVRLIRDKTTHLGKGFGYVLLRDVSTAAKALALNGQKMGKRELRVTVCGKRFKNTQGEKKVDGKFEGRRARPGAQMRLQKKRQLDDPVVEDAATPAKKPKAAEGKTPFVKANTGDKKKPFVKGDRSFAKVGSGADKKRSFDKKPFAKRAGGAKPVIGKFKGERKDKAPREKVQKPKHAARKARQALEAAQAAKARKA
ncbi:Aste57867_24108 [Aphanomyces stellatus]|uniref:Aste57867_24108 protein n=1 Tax=Aphanomyces stellatus TaxID=120398 RepID=A0A485LPI4_9STRA|nr:hypothetical protein As57867_024035 [Aphanomyces stellatus]VFU00750.1 Aste57867_24108 [Aphanomyces stellatus]